MGMGTHLKTITLNTKKTIIALIICILFLPAKAECQSFESARLNKIDNVYELIYMANMRFDSRRGLAKKEAIKLKRQLKQLMPDTTAIQLFSCDTLFSLRVEYTELYGVYYAYLIKGSDCEFYLEKIGKDYSVQFPKNTYLYYLLSEKKYDEVFKIIGDSYHENQGKDCTFYTLTLYIKIDHNTYNVYQQWFWFNKDLYWNILLDEEGHLRNITF